MLFKSITRIVLTAFLFNATGFTGQSHAQTVLNLPIPGQMVVPSISFVPLHLKGVEIGRSNPFQFNFLVDKGQSKLAGPMLKNEIIRLSKYFLTCLTVPQGDVWVNLSPYEHQHIAAHGFGQTQMGKDLLEQDYLLKQMVASLTYPEREPGKMFWKQVYQKAYEIYGTTSIPMDMYHKVWIVPKQAQVYVHGQSAVVVSSRLNVLLEEDYKASLRNGRPVGSGPSKIYTQAFRDIILPVLQREVNRGKNFAVVRQVYDAMILATWYKRHLNHSILSRIYVGKNKVKGVDAGDIGIKEKIYQQYLKAFKKRVYDYIREDYDPGVQGLVSRKYVSGGMDFAMFGAAEDNIYRERVDIDPALLPSKANLALAQVDVFPETPRRPLITRRAAALALGIMVSVAGIFWGPADASAEIFKAASNGTVVIQIEQGKGDTYGGAIQKIGQAFKQVDAEGYRHSVYSKPLWGRQGAVAILAGGKNMDVVVPGHTYTVSAPVPPEAMRVLAASAIEAAQPPQPPKSRQESAPVQGVPSTPVVAKPVTLEQTPSKPYVQQTEASAPERQTSLSAPPKEDRIQTSWISLGGLLLGIGTFLGIGRILMALASSPAVRRSLPMSQGSSASAALSLQVPSSEPLPADEREASFNTSAPAKLQPLRPTFEVPSQQPALGSPEELAGLAQQQEELQRIKTQQYALAPTEPFRILDIGGWLSGMAAAVYAYGLDPFSLAVSAALIPFATRGLYAVQVWIHEVIGHALPAAVLHPSKTRAALGVGNLSGNLSGRQWLDIFLPWRSARVNAHVLFPAIGIKDRIVRTSAGIVTLATGILSLTYAVSHALEQYWLVPMLGPLFFSFAAVLKASIESDLIVKAKQEGKYECGNYGVFWIGPGGDKNPGWVRQGLENLLRRLIVRGGQSAGQVSIDHDQDGKAEVFLAKVVKGKRNSNDLVGKLLGKFAKTFKFRHETGDGLEVHGINGHVRYATGGPVLRNASHPHLGPIEQKNIWTIQGGEFVSSVQNVGVVITHNGDNDYYHLLDKELDLTEIRSFFPKLVHFSGDLPPGDSPPIALQIHFHLTQGNWDASVRYAHVMANHETAQRAMEDILSAQEEHEIGQVFEGVFKQYLHLLSRPNLKNPHKAFKDLWVTQETAGRSPALQFQFETLEAFKEALSNALQEQVRRQTPAGAIIRRWKQTPQMRRDFINLAVKKFFTGDRYTATKEFQARARGSYGLVVRTTLKQGQDEDGVTIYSRAQGMAVAYNLTQGFFAFASDPLVLQGNFGDKGKLESMLILDPTGQGELADVSLSKSSRTLHLRVYSVAAAHDVSAAELAAREYQLRDENPYHKPLVEYPDLKNIPDEDLRRTTAELAQSRASWEDPLSFNRQSAEAMVEMLVSRYAEQYIKAHSMHYPLIGAQVVQQVYALFQECLGDGSCSQEQRDFLSAEAARRSGTQSFLARMVIREVDQEIASYSDEIGKYLMKGWMNPDQLFETSQAYDQHLGEVIDGKIKKLMTDLQLNFQKVRAQLNKEEEAAAYTDIHNHLDFFISGYENSLWLGENFKDLLLTLMPGLQVKAVSSNKILKNPQQYGITPRTIGMIFSKSGTTFPSLGQADLLNKLTRGHTFAMGGRIDNLTNAALGQKFGMDAPFLKRSFVTGNYYPAEASTISEISLYANQIELAIYLAERLRQIFPYDHPWGLRTTAEDIDLMEKLMDSMVKESQTISGFNAQGQPVPSTVHAALTREGRYLGGHLLETPVNNLYFRMAVTGIFYLGAPIQQILAFFGVHAGPPLHSVSGFAVTFADLSFAIGLPFILTSLVYRSWTGRPRWARMGAPSLVVGDYPFLHQTTEGYVSKLGAYAPGSMGMQVHGGNPEDHFGARFAHRIVRGTVIVAGLPVLGASRDAFLVTLKQAKAIKSKLLWFKDTGAEVVTIGRGKFANADVTDQHVDIGEQSLLKNASALVKDFNNLSFDAFGRMIAYKVLFNAMYKKASQITLLPRLSIGAAKHHVNIQRKYVQIWNRAWTYPSISVHSTRSPVGINEGAVSFAQGLGSADTSKAAVHQDQAMAKGGIDFDGRRMALSVEGKNDTVHDFGFDPKLLTASIEGMVPKVSYIVPVTAAMLQRIVGEHD